MRIKAGPPRSASIGEQDIDMVSCLGHFRRETFQFVNSRTVSWDGDCVGSGPFVRESVQGRDGFVACLFLAGGDVDF